MTDQAVFSSAEWSMLLRLPHWVVKAASAAQRDGTFRTAAETESGFITIAYGRESGNTFVTKLADLLVEADGAPVNDDAPIDFSNTEAGIGAVVARAETATKLLTAKADPADAIAYRRWLLAIVDVVIRAARSGDVLGIGGRLITPPEQAFRDQMATVLHI